MRLGVTHANLHLKDGPEIKAVDEVTTPTLIGICVGSAFFILTLAAVSYFCYRRRAGYTSHKLLSSKKHYSQKPIVLKKPTAVKSPSSGPIGPILKKSPSPPGHGISPGQKSPSEISTCSQDKHKNCPDITNDIENEPEEDKIPTPVTEEVENKEKDVEEEKVKKLGKLHFRLKYTAEKYSLLVTIVRCTDIPPKDPNAGTSDPYVKLQLLPEKQHKVKTRVLRKTLNPVYDEDFTFYGINPNQLQATTLHFVVLSFDRYSRDDVIGEVICPMAGLDFDCLAKQMSLSKEIMPRNIKVRSQGRGDLLVSLCYQPAANRLTVVVLKARNLPKMDITGLCDPYVKIYLLYNNQRIAKKKTHVKKRTVNPVFNESFVFDVPYNEGLENISLEFLVLDWDRVTKNEVIGHLELGDKFEGAAQLHWQEVCNSPRRQIAEWHKLRD
ncbi:synaptotagmin-4-like [Centruroides vittatus]|uniref:synaptotagmin-4-like n=1 Tax=Centruroides vittatus TaxID=120091 RepID=UPI00350FADB1